MSSTNKLESPETIAARQYPLPSNRATWFAELRDRALRAAVEVIRADREHIATLLREEADLIDFDGDVIDAEGHDLVLRTRAAVRAFANRLTSGETQPGTDEPVSSAALVSSLNEQPHCPVQRALDEMDEALAPSRWLFSDQALFWQASLAMTHLREALADDAELRPFADVRYPTVCDPCGGGDHAHCAGLCDCPCAAHHGRVSAELIQEIARNRANQGRR